MEDYPNEKDFPNFRNRFGPRGVMHSWATDTDDPTEEPRWGKVGKQRVTDTGPLTKKRMETCDDEFIAAAKDFIKRQNDAGKPFFVWLNPTHMHLYTHPKPESKGQAGRWQSPYHDTMIDHDKNVGQVLDYLDELGIADDTFVMYSTDNGPHMNSWPDGGMTPFRSEKNTNWEGAFRVPDARALAGQDQAGPDLERDRPAPRLVPDLPRHGRRSGRRREAQERLSGDRPHLQEPHRRLQSCALPHRRGEGEPAQVLHVFERRRRRAGLTLRQLEDGVHGAALPRHAADLGGAVHPAQNTEALQSAHRPLRAGGSDVQHLLGLVHSPHLHVVRRAGGSPPNGRRPSRTSRRFRSPTPSPSTTH